MPTDSPPEYGSPDYFGQLLTVAKQDPGAALRQLSEDVPPEPTNDARPLIDELLRLFETCSLDHANDPRLLIGLGWWVRVNRLAKAIATLDDQGLTTEAIPCARSAFEHSMALVLWSSEDERLLGGIGRRALKDLARAIRGATESTGQMGIQQLFFEAMGEQMSTLPEGEWEWGFAADLDQLGIRSSTYPFYIGMTLFTHPTIFSAAAFVDLVSSLALARVPQSRIVEMAGTPILWALQCQCWAALSIDRLLPSGLAWRADLLEVVRRIDLPLVEKLFPQ